jgi:hypothetical protein
MVVGAPGLRQMVKIGAGQVLCKLFNSLFGQQMNLPCGGGVRSYVYTPVALDMPSSCRLACAPALLIGLDKSKRIFTSNTAFLNFEWLVCAVVGQYPMLLVRVERGLIISGHKNYGNYARSVTRGKEF